MRSYSLWSLIFLTAGIGCMERPQRPPTPTSTPAEEHVLETEYPNDADGDALRRVAADGSDMTKPMDIDFFVLAPNRVSANAIQRAAAAAGFKATILDAKPGEAITVECVRRTVPSYDAVVRSQRELHALSVPFGGELDGWGTFGNATRPPPSSGTQ